MITSLSNYIVHIGEKLENEARFKKDFFEFKYITRPVYKSCVRKVGPVIATAISFLSADLLIHQLLGQTARCVTQYIFKPILPNSVSELLQFEDSCTITWKPVATALWMGVAIPVMYAKYRRAHPA
ncbi:MAG: hypothetical protein JWO53_1307 [Chlamydiia bacterium]|nr:hypothetical protein [Chlamydiia bacterium]